MKLQSFEEFIKSLTPVVQGNQDDVNLTESQKATKVLMQQVSIVCLNHIECYHKWLAKQLEDNTQSTEKDIS